MTAPTPPEAVTRVPVASFHAAASVDAEVLTQSLYGRIVRIVERKPGWVDAATADGTRGWVVASHLHDAERVSHDADGSRAIRVGALFAHVYREAAACRQPPILTVPFETVFDVLPDRPGAKPKWLEVRLVDGGSGWIQNGDVVPVEQRLSVEELIAQAPRFVGLPFTWGGVTTFGFDCSGFIQMLCRQRGVFLPRRLAHQIQWLENQGLATDAPEAGDIAMFGTDPIKVTHIALMLTRDRFVHSTVVGRPVVQISHLSDDPWCDRLKGFRRIQDDGRAVPAFDVRQSALSSG